MHYASPDEPRLLFLDIETRPAIIASFGIRDQHITHKQIIQDGGTICVGYKWAGDKRAKVLSEWEHGYSEMIRQTHALLSEADAVATYNGASFDIPKLMGCFLLERLDPPPPPTQIDIYKAVRKLGFICNKLDYIAPLLGLGGKVKHDGLEMWLAVMDGDAKAQRKMAKYCAGDVELTEQVYERVRAYVPDHPHMGMTPALSCGACGSHQIQSRGVRRTKASFIQRLQCIACGSWQSGKRTRAA
jgi:uncharacterized protein YprB with RNaseH-like and TPR domain